MAIDRHGSIRTTFNLHCGLQSDVGCDQWLSLKRYLCGSTSQDDGSRQRQNAGDVDRSRSIGRSVVCNHGEATWDSGPPLWNAKVRWGLGSCLNDQSGWPAIEKRLQILRRSHPPLEAGRSESIIGDKASFSATFRLTQPVSKPNW